MTDTQDLIARLRDYSGTFDHACINESADALEAAQAEIEAVRKANVDCVNHFDALRIDYEAALARIAKLEPKRNVSPPSEELVLHKMRYHFWEAVDDDEPADFELFDAGVECDTCIDVALVRQDRLDELIAAAGASPQPSPLAFKPWSKQAEMLESWTAGASPVQPSESAEHWHSLYLKKCQELHDEKARLGAEIETLELAAIDDEKRYAVQPSQAVEQQEPVAYVVDGGKKNGSLLHDWQYHNELVAPKIMCKPLYAAPAVQPSQADAQDAARYRWLREYLPSDDLQYDDDLVLAKTGAEIDAAIDAAINAKGAV